MATNHCGRLSRMIGALERQEWASEIVSRARASSAPAPCIAAMTALFAPPGLPLGVMMASPPKRGRSAR